MSLATEEIRAEIYRASIRARCAAHLYRSQVTLRGSTTAYLALLNRTQAVIGDKEYVKYNQYRQEECFNRYDNQQGNG